MNPSTHANKPSRRSRVACGLSLSKLGIAMGADAGGRGRQVRTSSRPRSAAGFPARSSGGAPRALPKGLGTCKGLPNLTM